MLTATQKSEIKNLVSNSLNKAEQVWSDVGDNFRAVLEGLSEDKIATAEVVPSQIPGYPLVNDGKPIVDEFIALIADMRDSSKHLLNAISKKKAKVSQLNRVYYETSALLPAMAKGIEYEKGNVTEYLGDGILALFQLNRKDNDETIYAAFDAATNCINDIRNIVNKEINERYSLPPLNIGVGLSYSKAIVTLVGLERAKQAKIIGECVYRASKLSCGINEIFTDKYLKSIWPSSPHGTLKFRQLTKIDNFEGYLIYSN